MDEKTVVLSSSRAIRQQILQSESSLFLPDYLTVSEFISKLCIVEGYRTIDEDSRILLLLEAADFKEFHKLQIERNFFTFTKNSSYIFKFFEELSGELYEIGALHQFDMYAEFEEHITILKELFVRYEKLCEKHKLLDRIFLPKLYRLNTAFLQSKREIELHVDGYLTKFELLLLKEACKHTQIKIFFTASEFNLKMQEIFQNEGFEIETNHTYVLDFNKKQIHKKEKLSKNYRVTCESVSEEGLEIAFVKHKIYEFVQKGYAPQKIAVILPDEQKSSFLKEFDTKHNLNFAMGEPFSKSGIYRLLEANIESFEQHSQESEHRVERLGENIGGLILSIYQSGENVGKIFELLKEVTIYINSSQELSIYEEELYRFERVLEFLQGMSPRQILNLFMQRLSGRSIDDVRGGKITVMGVLESRGVSFEGVVIIDFDENNVPKKSDKDMFLSTQIRQLAKLPTTADRENLQKHYYTSLFHNSKEVAICYVHNEQNLPSRFLKQLGIRSQNRYSEKEYAQVLFAKSSPSLHVEEPGEVLYDFTKSPLSASALKTFLTCKRRFYYNYVKRLKEHSIPTDMPQSKDIGDLVHSALKNLYEKHSFFSDVAMLRADLHKELEALVYENEFIRYEIALQKKLLEPFCHNEIERFEAGWRVFKTEEPLKCSFGGVELHGRCDRIDKNAEGVLSVLDYKTGSYTLYNAKNFQDASDFQLEFYYLFAKELAEVGELGFYDLKEGRVVTEMMLEEKLAILESHLRDLSRLESFMPERCEDVKHCLYCPYKTVCGRE